MRLSKNIFKTILNVPDQLNLSLLLLMHITTLELLLMQIKHYLKKKTAPTANSLLYSFTSHYLCSLST